MVRYPKRFALSRAPGFQWRSIVFFFWNSPMWIWSFVSPQREFLAADVRIILHEFGGWSTSIIVWWGKSASATFRFLPMFVLQTQNMNISNNSNILQLECVKSRLCTILLRLPFNLGYFVAIWFRAFSHCSKWTGATWQRWHHDKEPAWDHRCLKVWLVKHQSSTKGSQAILGPFRSLFHKKWLFARQNFTGRAFWAVSDWPFTTSQMDAAGATSVNCYLTSMKMQGHPGTPVVQSRVPSPNWVWSWNIFKGNVWECQNVVGSAMEPHQKEFLSSGATFEFTGWETRGMADVCLNESMHQMHRIMQTWFA